MADPEAMTRMEVAGMLNPFEGLGAQGEVNRMVDELIGADPQVDTALDRRLAHRLRPVKRALQKIEEGIYGVCDATGGPIPRGRLEAAPEAIYTLEAQKRLEDLASARRLGNSR